MAKAKLVLIVALVLIVIVIMLQNTAAVETRILFVTLTMPRAVLLLATTAIGFTLGVLTALYLSRRGASAK